MKIKNLKMCEKANSKVAGGWIVNAEENTYFLRQGSHKSLPRPPNIQSPWQRQAKSQIWEDEEESSARNPRRQKIVDKSGFRFHINQISLDGGKYYAPCKPWSTWNLRFIEFSELGHQRETFIKDDQTTSLEI